MTAPFGSRAHWSMPLSILGGIAGPISSQKRFLPDAALPFLLPGGSTVPSLKIRFLLSPLLLYFPSDLFINSWTSVTPLFPTFSPDERADMPQTVGCCRCRRVSPNHFSPWPPSDQVHCSRRPLRLGSTRLPFLFLLPPPPPCIKFRHGGEPGFMAG